MIVSNAEMKCEEKPGRGEKTKHKSHIWHSSQLSEQKKEEEEKRTQKNAANICRGALTCFREPLQFICCRCYLRQNLRASVTVTRVENLPGISIIKAETNQHACVIPVRLKQGEKILAVLS